MMCNQGFASLFSRWVLATLVGMIGYYKVFTLSPSMHAQKFFIEGFTNHWIPEWLLWPLGYSIPFIELITGVLLFLGLWVRYSAIVIGFLLVVVSYGHMLQDAFYNPTSHLMPRLILTLAVLLLYSSKDKWSLDYWLAKKA